MTLTTERAARLAEQIIERCHTLAGITDVPGRTTRTFLSDGMRRTNETVSAWMQAAGMETRVDAAGNLRGTLLGASHETSLGAAADSRRFLIGSHLDTVPNAGAFDGPLGVLMGVALAQQVGAGHLPFTLEVVGFSEEEGVRFGMPFIGSRALVGTLDAAALAAADRNGTTVQQALRESGLHLPLSTAQLSDAFGYLEFHIEQGPALESEGLPVSVVETIAGQSRLALTFRGRANHAGTTPMPLRHDALAAAAAFIVQVERTATSRPSLLATVGSIAALPNAGNVIAGEVRLSLDVRSAQDSVREDAVAALLRFAQELAKTRGLTLQVEALLTQPAVPLDRTLLRVLEDSVDANGAMIRRMTSGAGHDAMVLAPHLPAAMLFLRSPGGISHHPDETVRLEDVALALQIGYTFLHTLPLGGNA